MKKKILLVEMIIEKLIEIVRAVHEIFPKCGDGLTDEDTDNNSTLQYTPGTTLIWRHSTRRLPIALKRLIFYLSLTQLARN